MPRAAKTETTGTGSKARRRKADKAASLPPAPQHTDAELVYVQKYPNHRFVAGSLSLPGQPTIFGKKRTIRIVCARCNVAEREIATSDIFHCDKCVTCTKEAKKETRKERKTATA